MTTPDVPIRMELSFELPGPPELVWDAVATANGISSWSMPTDVEERIGGTVVTHMTEHDSSTGTVTGWDPPRRFAYEEPDWAAFVGHEGAPVTPLATEFVIDARPDGTCVLRVVTSALGTGADWEQGFLDEMQKYWVPYFDNLPLYLTHFAGQRVTSLLAQASVPGDGATVWSAMRRALGVGAVGQPVEVRGVSGLLERIGESRLLLRVTDPVSGLLEFAALDRGDGSTWTQVTGYLFSADAPGYVQREQPAWRAWLQGLAVPAAS